MKRFAVVLVMLVVVTFAAAPAAEAKAPRPCTQALDAAEEMASISADYAGGIAAYFASNAQAATRYPPTLTGITSMLNEMTTNTNALKVITDSITTRMTAARGAYDRAAKACRKS